MSDVPQKKSSLKARLLDSKTVQRVAPGVFLHWLETSQVYQGVGYKAGEKPPESGVALVQSPYSDWYNLTWGLAPNQDMPKWRWMFRARPEIKRGIDVKTILAVGRGMTIQCDKDREVEEYANRLLNHVNMRQMLQEAVSDMLVYGTAYMEKIRARPDEVQEHEELQLEPLETRMSAQAIPGPQLSRQWTNSALDGIDETQILDGSASSGKVNEWKGMLKAYANDLVMVENWLDAPEVKEAIGEYTAAKGHEYRKSLWKARRWKATMSDAHDQPRSADIRDDDSFFEEEPGELIELKPLDPLWMRVCRDAFGNIIGWVQWGLTPIPQAILNEKLVVFRWMPKSWAHENAYGTSVLMPVQRHVSFIVQSEEDMKVFWHQYAKPMLVAYGGTSEKPYPNAALSAIANKLFTRGPTTDVVMPGDTKVEMMQSGAGKGTSQTFALYVKYLREKIYETLGVPSILMNLPGDTSRGTSDVTLQAFIAEEEMIQEYVGEQVLAQILEPEVRRRFADKYPSGNIPLMHAVFAPVLEEDRNKKFDRIVKGVGMQPFMTVNEARAQVGLPAMIGPDLDPTKYDRIPESVAPTTTLSGNANPDASDAISNEMAPSRNPEESESGKTGFGEEVKQKEDRQVASVVRKKRLTSQKAN